MGTLKDNRTGLLIGAAGFIVIVSLVAWLGLREPEPAHLLPAPLPHHTPVAPSTPPPGVAVTTPPPTAPTPSNVDMFASLKAAPDAATARDRAKELRAGLEAMPAGEAVAAIRGFLDSKADAPSHMGFKVSTDGMLEEAPTLRTLLLDELARIDPAAAADYAKVILASKDSPDEWALALRNLARGDATPLGRTVLEQKAAEMLLYTPWQQAPSVGFLEAFDVAVYLGGTKLLPVLSEMVRRQDDPAMAHASFLAMDRLVINDTASTLGALQATPELMVGREVTRANYFARGDVRDPQQRQILENYLFDPQISPAELEAFAGVFPNANFMLSPNLLTKNQTPDHANLLGRDAESLRVVREWLADPARANRRPVLEKMAQRLGEFVRQASAKPNL